MKKAQSSVEFLIILGIALTIIMILSGVFFSYFNSAKQNLDKQQLTNIGNDLISNIERIYFMGSGNRITQQSNFPDGIVNFTIEHFNISNGTNYNQFEVINITFYDSIAESSLLFYPIETYVKIDCDRCQNTTPLNGNYTSYFNQSMFSQGPKEIRLETRGDTVYLSFTR